MFNRKTERPSVTQEAVLAALGTVIEPELHRDLVSLNMIRDLKVDGDDVAFTIMLTTPACPCGARWRKTPARHWPACPALAR